MANENAPAEDNTKIEFQAKIREFLIEKKWNPAEELIGMYEDLCANPDKMKGKGEKREYADGYEIMELQRKIVVDLEKLAQKEEEINIKKVEAMKGLGNQKGTWLYTPGMKEKKLPDGRTVVVPMDTMTLEDRSHEK